MLYVYLIFISIISYAKIGRVIRVRSEIAISQLLLILSFYSLCFTVTLLAIQVMPRLVHFFSRLVLNLYTTDYNLYFVNCRRTKKAVRQTQFFGFSENITIFGLN